MSDFTPSKKTAQDFNSGVEYIDEVDSVQAETINDLIESALYSQDTAESAVDTANQALSNVNQVIENKTLLPDVQKNYYNLGAFDTYVSNGDGTGTVTRETGIEHFNGSEAWEYNSAQNGRFYRTLSQNTNIKTNTTGQYVKVNQPSIVFNGIETNKSLYIVDDTIYIRYDNANGNIAIFKQWLSQNPLIVEYKITDSYEEQVIENQPIRISNQEEELYWHEEWGKGLNLYKGIQSFVEGNNNLTSDGELPVGTYTIILSRTGTSNSQIIGGGITAGDNVIVYPNTPRTFTTKNTAKLSIYINEASLVTSIMLVKGTIPYPYSPYNGSIIHEKDLSGIQLFSANVNPAQTIGGDWEDLGTVTVGSTTLHAYQKVS